MKTFKMFFGGTQVSVKQLYLVPDFCDTGLRSSVVFLKELEMFIVEAGCLDLRSRGKTLKDKQ